MNLAQTIQQHVEKFPPEKQAEVLDFVLFLEQKLKHCPQAENPIKPDNPLKLLLESDFIGCAESEETKLSQTYKTELTETLEKKQGYR